MTVLETPAAAFAGLPDYPFAPHFVAVADGLRVHYVDEGPRGGPVVLLLHGEPSWSYLYRRMIPVFAAAGYRVLAPDLIGFGKSSKPASQSDYTYARHLEWMATWLEELDIRDINMFCQDWGGLIGLRLLAAQPDRFARLVVSNTGLPTGKVEPPAIFKQWVEFARMAPQLPVGGIIQQATDRDLTPAEVAAYDAPFPAESYKAGARVFPSLVPHKADDPEAVNNLTAWKTLADWGGPVLTLFSDNDPITKGGAVLFQRMPGAAGRAHRTVAGGHFVQEDAGPELAAAMVDFMGNN